MSTMIMRNYANNAQAKVPKVITRRSIFPITKSRKQTMKAGWLIPIFYEEVLPSDTWEIQLSAFVRLMPQITSPIDNLTISTYFFFDPYRLVWDNFTKQHGERKNPNDTIDYTTPKMTVPTGGFTAKSLQDYLGKPTGKEIATTSLSERIYNHIYNNYFRSEFLQNSAYENTSDTDDITSNYPLRRITKAHDYFTDCLPTLQQGDPVSIPLGTTAPIIADGSIKFVAQGDTVAKNLGSYTAQGASPANVLFLRGDPVTGTNNVNYSSGLKVDLTNAVSADISALRLMIQTQEILERDNRNGVRYTEMLEGRYGAINPDLRLQRPQYLGGTRTPMFTTPVVQTSGTGITDQSTPQGNIAGYSTAGDGGKVIKQSFGEFGAIMGLMAITTTPQYQNGCHRKFTRFERFDYMYPEFMGISDQAVKNKEINAQDDTILGADGITPENDETFGFIPRYDEYRYFTNEICGELKSNYSQSLDVWTYAEKFENQPVLNDNFIQDKSDVILERSMAIQRSEEGIIEDQFLVDLSFTGAVTRILTSKAIPQTGGRIL